MSYNKHNLKKARHNAALQGYAYFLVKGKIAHVEVCHNMLTNEKYIGQVLMQKTYTSDFLTGKQVKNQGQLAMYLVEDAHEPIIDLDTFEKVQAMKGCIKQQITPDTKENEITMDQSIDG